MIPGSLWLSESAETDFKVPLVGVVVVGGFFRLQVSGFVTAGPVAADFILNHYQLVPAAKNNNIVFVLPLKLFLMDILYAADVTPGRTKRTLF